MGRFDLVIFDCDGVLVDSERLAIRVEAEILTGLGWSLTESDIVEGFVGRSAAYMHQEIERHLGRSASSSSAKTSNSMCRWKHAAVTTEWAEFPMTHRGCAATVLWVEALRSAAGTVPGVPARWPDRYCPVTVAGSAAGVILLRAALKIRRTTAPMMARSSSIWADTTRRAASVRGVMSPKPTVEKMVMVK